MGTNQTPCIEIIRKFTLTININLIEQQSTHENHIHLGWRHMIYYYTYFEDVSIKLLRSKERSVYSIVFLL